MSTPGVKAAFILTLLILLSGCTEPKFDINEKNSNVKTFSDDVNCTITLVGDKDGFGMGISDRGTLNVPAGTPLPFDHRNSNDPSFTDIYSAEMGESSNPPHQFHYTMDFAKPTKSIVGAKLRLNTLGIQDGDHQVLGSDTDIKVYLDGEEIPNALDNVDQFDFINGAWADFASIIEIEIPSSLLHVLDDGKVEVKWVVLAVNPTCQCFDAFAIDYCELEICVENAER